MLTDEPDFNWSYKTGIRTHDGQLLEATMLMSMVSLILKFEVNPKCVVANLCAQG